MTAVGSLEAGIVAVQHGLIDGYEFGKFQDVRLGECAVLAAAKNAVAQVVGGLQHAVLAGVQFVDFGQH